MQRPEGNRKSSLENHSNNCCSQDQWVNAKISETGYLHCLKKPTSKFIDYCDVFNMTSDFFDTSPS